MYARSWRALLATVALTLATGAASPLSAQRSSGSSEAALRRRVVQLENRVLQLEQEIARMRELSEAQAPALARAGATRPASAHLILAEREGWRRRENWRRLQLGLSELDVRRLLGEPDRVIVDRFTSIWIYPTRNAARVAFGLEGGRVEGWAEP